MQLVEGAQLIDGTGGPPLADAAVLVNDQGRIEAVGPRQSVSSPPGTDVISATGMTLLPGLIDCHDHLSSFTYDLMSRWRLTEPGSLRNLRIAKVAEETLLTGYTTIRDCGWLDAGFKMAIEEGLISGPRLMVATMPMSPTHGHADRSSGSGHSQPAFPDPLLPLGIADGPEEVRAKVRELVRVGADLIKVFETGFGRPLHRSKDQAYGRDELDALVSEAHIHERTVACHAVGGPGLRMSIEAGVDSIEHGSYLNQDPDLLNMMAGEGIFFVPTFTVFNFHRTEGTPTAQAESADFRQHHIDSVQQALKVGVKVVAGTDAGGWGHPHNAMELECLVDAGMTPMQALVAGTGWAAECCGLGKDIGTVEKGKWADLVVVDGNPLTDIKLLQEKGRIKMIMKEGKTYANYLTSPESTP